MKLKLVKKVTEAKGTKSFFWEPEREVKWLPGQFYYFTLPKLNYPDPKGSTRHFTISSSPTEGNLLRLTTRIREESGYKKTLDKLPVGTEIEGEGPSGTFILDENEPGPHVFLAGGIGITPFRSFIKYSADKGLSAPFYLIYSNSVPEEIAFREELAEWEKSLPNLKVGLTISKPEEGKEKWTGVTGRIDEALVKKLLGDWQLNLNAPTWWVVGPPVFVDVMEVMFGKMKVSSDRVRSEKFTGY